MPDIVALLECLQPLLTATTLRQFSKIIVAMLAMTGRVTMLGLSRWAGPGGSYRTVQRFFQTVLPWATLFWLSSAAICTGPTTSTCWPVMRVVIGKAGEPDLWPGSLLRRVVSRMIPGLAFFTLALISTHQRRSLPGPVEQVLRTEGEKAASRAKTAAKQASKPAEPRKRGRPKGSKNKLASVETCRLNCCASKTWCKRNSS